MVVRFLLGLTFALMAAVAVAQDGRAQHSTQKFIDYEIFDRVEAADGVATITIGKNFSASEFASQQDVVRVSLEYLRSEDPTIEMVTLIDGTGRKVGTYTKDGLKLQSE